MSCLLHSLGVHNIHVPTGSSYKKWKWICVYIHKYIYSRTHDGNELVCMYINMYIRAHMACLLHSPGFYNSHIPTGALYSKWILFCVYIFICMDSRTHVMRAALSRLPQHILFDRYIIFQMDADICVYLRTHVMRAALSKLLQHALCDQRMSTSNPTRYARPAWHHRNSPKVSLLLNWGANWPFWEFLWCHAVQFRSSLRVDQRIKILKKSVCSSIHMNIELLFENFC